MTTSTPGTALRICAEYSLLAETEMPCVACEAERCRPEACATCGAKVHYDPAASIPAFPNEIITCTECFVTVELKLQERERDGYCGMCGAALNLCDLGGCGGRLRPGWRTREARRPRRSAFGVVIDD